MKKIIFFLIVLCMITTCFGCESGMHENKETTTEAYSETTSETYSENMDEEYERLTAYFNSITDSMLNSCNIYPTLDSYWNDSLILLNRFNDDIRLYGISVGEDSAMLLYVQNEKVLLNYAYKNFYQELPKLNSTDIDSDGVDEVIISRRTGTGSPGNWYALLVCDYDTTWNIYEYNDYVQDIDALIDYRYDEDSNTIVFLNKEEVITEIELPEWTEEYPYKGVVDFENDVRFDAETMQMEVAPWILLENSLPYTPVTMVFSVRYINGEFEIDFLKNNIDIEEHQNPELENEDEIIA